MTANESAHTEAGDPVVVPIGVPIEHPAAAPDSSSAEAPASEESVSSGSGATEGPYFASIFPGGRTAVTPALGNAVEALQGALGMPVWLLVQPHGPSHEYAQIDEPLRRAFYSARAEFGASSDLALVVDSPGGSARAAYQIASLMRRRCEGFTVVVPRYAKSAATLLSLGAQRLYMGPDAELGPLDAQLFDMDREDWASALDEVQALERLNVAALEQFDQAMMLLMQRTGKKIETLIPQALKYTTDMMHPLLVNIDTVHYIKQSRVLKVAEEYASRLLTPWYGEEVSRKIAFVLVNNYPEHAFVIDRNEAKSFLALTQPTAEIEAAIDNLAGILTEQTTTVIGRLAKGGRDEQ